MTRVRFRQGTREFDERKARILKLRDKGLSWREIGIAYGKAEDTVRSYVHPKCKVKVDPREHVEYIGDLPELDEEEKAQSREDYLTGVRVSSMLAKAQDDALGRTLGVKNTERQIDRGMKLVMGGKQWRGNAD